MRSSRFPWALLAVIAAVLFTGYVRLRVAGVPLERDEGEYAYAGRLILEGVPPYKLAYNMKFPGTYYAYAAIMATFGETPWGIHAGLLLVNAASILLVYAVGRRLLGAFEGAAAAILFALLSLDRWVYGVFAHATHFVVLAVMAGLLLLLRAMERERTAAYLGSGLLFGVALVMKQHAVVYLPFAAAAVYFLGKGRDLRRTGIFTLGSVLPLAVVVAMLSAQGVVGRFWFWTFQYARQYVTELPLTDALPYFTGGFGRVTTASLPFWVLAALGFFAMWTPRWEMRTKLILTGLFVASFIAICPGFYFREHYFILVLPAVALLGAVAIASLRKALEPKGGKLAAAAAVGALVAIAGLYVAREGHYLFSMGTRELSRTMYGSNPFLEAVDIGRYIHDRSEPADRIAVIGSEPEIYFYADRKGATGYIYTYALMEPQPFASKMQAEMVHEIEAAHPRYVVFCRIDRSWLASPASDQSIVMWTGRYVQQCYDLVGIADIYSEEASKLAWDAEAQTYRAQSDNVLYTFRRKGDAACVVTR